jgi:integrase
MPLTDIPRNSVFDRPAALGLTGRQFAEVLPSLLAFLEEHKPHVGQILMGREEKQWTNRDLRVLERVVIQESANAGTARDYLRVLRKGCAFWAAGARAKVAYPRIPICTQEPKNPFQRNLPRQLQRYRDWKNVLQNWLKGFAAADETGTKSSPDLSIEFLVVSAVLYGGLQSKPALLALIHAARNAESRSFCVNGKMHVELSLSWHGMPNMEFRRWQPDALSATPWARLQPEAVKDLLSAQAGDNGPPGIPDRQIMKRLDLRLRDLIKRTQGVDRKFIGGLDKLLQAGQAAAYIELPSILAAYAGRKLISHSLKRQALQRLSTETIITAGDPQPTPANDPTNRTVASAAGPLQLPDDLEEGALKRLRASMTSTNSEDLRYELGVLAARIDASPFEKRMADFGIWLLQVRTRSGKVRSVGSAKRALIDLTRYMAPTLEDQDPVSLDSEVLETTYGQMLESVGQLVGGAEMGEQLSPTSKRRRNLARAILEFHRYMMVQPRNKEPLADGTFLTGELGLAPVDANLLTIEGYNAVLIEINKHWLNGDELQTIARLLVIMAFRTGLRRLEVLHCLTDDIVPGTNAEFIVRPSAMRRLKSRNARRRIPLRIFLTEKELDDLLAWRELRLVYLKPEKSGFLFGVGKSPDAVPQTIIGELNQILVSVTNDKSIHFHQLRHSGAGLNWLRCFLSDFENPPDIFPDLQETTAWLHEGRAKRSELYGHNRPTRKHTYQLAQLWGHGSPATFMQSYQHFS